MEMEVWYPAGNFKSLLTKAAMAPRAKASTTGDFRLATMMAPWSATFGMASAITAAGSRVVCMTCCSAPGTEILPASWMKRERKSSDMPAAGIETLKADSGAASALPENPVAAAVVAAATPATLAARFICLLSKTFFILPCWLIKISAASSTVLAANTFSTATRSLTRPVKKADERALNAFPFLELSFALHEEEPTGDTALEEEDTPKLATKPQRDCIFRLFCVVCFGGD
mmetsp:Transcript_21160/g.36332  ORF Transcript_21160/g.36332 Transcript_21160/m.36332 type:complete len:230 (-) Transcript_21160:49-738(-)